MNRLVSLSARLGWLASFGIHTAAAAWLLQSAHREHLRTPLATVTLSVVSAPRVHQLVPVPPVQTKEHSEDELPAPRAAPKPIRKSASPAAPVVPTPVDLPGVTLTEGQGAAWASVTGNGLAMDTPIRAALATPGTAAAPVPSTPMRVTRPPRAPVEVVAVRELAAKPTPPSLNNKLLVNYPAPAKQQGQSGSARLLVRIDADGVVRHCSVQSESSAEFGAACRRTLLGSQWSAPQDRAGNAVATQVSYTCVFRVGGS